VTPYRERDLRNLIRDLLDQTGAFDGVYLSGLPEASGRPAGESRSAAVEPGETSLAMPEPWDDAGGDLLLNCRVNLTLQSRHEDPQLRDELAELLLCIAANALNGSTLGGASLPGRTRIRSWSWQKPIAPERRILAVLEYQYLVDGQTGFNTAE
jgi:hypothetical protein